MRTESWHTRLKRLDAILGIGLTTDSAPTGTPTVVRPAGSQFLTDLREIERIFRVFRDQCSPVALRFDEAEGEFAARVIDVNKSQVFIDDVHPRTGMPFLRDQAPFTLTGRIEGIYVRADALSVTEVAVERHVPYFVFELPTQLLYQQRRRSARFRLPLSVSPDGARITLHRASRSLTGYIVDISAGGCRTMIDGLRTDPSIALDEIVERCDIDIPQLLEVSARAVIRHHSFEASAGTLTCGIEFTAMSVGDRRRLEHFIAKIAKVATPA